MNLEKRVILWRKGKGGRGGKGRGHKSAGGGSQGRARLVPGHGQVDLRLRSEMGQGWIWVGGGRCTQGTAGQALGAPKP